MKGGNFMSLLCDKSYCEHQTSQGYCKFTACKKQYIASPQEIKDGIEYHKRILEEDKKHQAAKRLEKIRSRKPIVINLFGAPGAGKSTGAAVVFAALKQAGINAELITEFAKDKTWEHNATALGCQEYVFGKQSYRLARCKADVDVIVTDSPLPLSILYTQDPALLADGAFQKVVMNVFNSYHNCNYFINRTKKYNPKGRNQTEEQSDAIAGLTLKLLEDNGVKYVETTGDTEGYQKIVEDVLDYIGVVSPKEKIVESKCKECRNYGTCLRSAAAGLGVRCPTFGDILEEVRKRCGG